MTHVLAHRLTGSVLLALLAACTKPEPSATGTAAGRTASTTVDTTRAATTATAGVAGSTMSACKLHYGDPVSDQNLCFGVPEFSLRDNQHAEFHAQWIAGLPFLLQGEEEDRKPDAPTSTEPRVRVQVIDRAARVRLAALGSHEIVMARLEITRASDKREGRYKLGAHPSLDFGPVFYLVVDQPTNSGEAKPGGKVIARWQVYGIVQGRLREVPGAKGKIVECSVEHDGDVRLHGAAFTQCIKQNNFARSASVATLPPLRGKTILEAAVGQSMISASAIPADSSQSGSMFSNSVLLALREVLDNPREDPVWFICGLGCCTADT